MTMPSTPISAGSGLIDRQVDFKVRDVFIPDPAKILDERYGNEILHGRVIDLTDSGTTKHAFAVVEVQGLSRHVIVPVACILDVL